MLGEPRTSRFMLQSMRGTNRRKGEIGSIRGRTVPKAVTGLRAHIIRPHEKREGEGAKGNDESTTDALWLLRKKSKSNPTRTIGKKKAVRHDSWWLRSTRTRANAQTILKHELVRAPSSLSASSLRLPSSVFPHLQAAGQHDDSFSTLDTNIVVDLKCRWILASSATVDSGGNYGARQCAHGKLASPLPQIYNPFSPVSVSPYHVRARHFLHQTGTKNFIFVHVDVWLLTLSIEITGGVVTKLISHTDIASIVKCTVSSLSLHVARIPGSFSTDNLPTVNIQLYEDERPRTITISANLSSTTCLPARGVLQIE
ncbi:hypothetical protein OF83DRAFT_1188309 [Amylostereum chailletii]|nr:hypothetical protein OF83DRAFT_1188309 [Amylostereum chailletii]